LRADLWDYLGWWTYLAVVGGLGPATFLSDLAILPCPGDGIDGPPGTGPGFGAGPREEGKRPETTDVG
jgi:hypothetical protein